MSLFKQQCGTGSENRTSEFCMESFVLRVCTWTKNRGEEGREREGGEG